MERPIRKRNKHLKKGSKHKMSIANAKKMIYQKNVLSVLKCFIRSGGLWNGIDHNGVHWLTRITIACFLNSLVLQFIALVKARYNLERLFECFSVFTFCGMGALKLKSLNIHGERWRFIISKMSALERTQLNDDSKPSIEYETNEELSLNHHPSYIRKYTERFQSIFTILRRIYSVTCVIFIISPFVEYGLLKMYGHTVSKPHVLPQWAPLDEVHISGYVVTVIFEIIGAVYLVYVHIAFDSLAVGLMILLCGQFELLQFNCMRIAGAGNDCFISKERDVRAHARIIKQHRIHVLLVSTMAELNEQIKNILGIYFIVATLTLCSVAVRLKSEALTVMQLVSLLQYMCASLTQLYLFCYYGDAVSHESSAGIGEGPFAAAYWCVSPSVRRELVLLSIGVSHARSMQAGPFNSLNLPSFVKIVRTAYSYYAVLGE